MDQKIAVISGANRGLGLATSEALANQGYLVVMLGREKDKIERAAAHLKEMQLNVIPYQVDITKDDQVKKLKETLANQFDHIDVLINNAGIILERLDDNFNASLSVMDEDINLIRQTFETNTLGSLRLCQALMPLLKKSKSGRIVNVSSGMGQLSAMDGYWPGYRMSKTALNALTRILHSELREENSPIKINSICPGWVKTDMGGPKATRTIAEGIKGIVWAATLPDSGPSGGFFRDGEPIPW
ncbi:MAG: SDR family oxidoreductase [Candidatus Berkiellales bacterium]